MYEELRPVQLGNTDTKLGGYSHLVSNETQAEIVKPRKNSAASYGSTSSPGKSSRHFSEQHCGCVLPPSSGPVTLLVQVKGHKHAMRLVQQLVYQAGLMNKLY